VGEEKGVDCSGTAAGIVGTAGTDGTSDRGRTDAVLGCSARDDTGTVPLSLCVVVAAGDINAGSGLPGTDTPGTRGNEYISSAAGMLRPVAKGSALDSSSTGPGVTRVAVGKRCAEDTSAPLGGAVGGDEGADGTAGNEYISLDGGSTGAAAQGAPLLPSKTSDDELCNSDGAIVGDASPAAPAREAAIARKSASFRGPNGNDEGDCGAIGCDGGLCCLPNVTTTRGSSGIRPNGAEFVCVLPKSMSPEGETGVVGCPGKAAKNSLASFAMIAGSGSEGKAADSFSYSCASCTRSAALADAIASGPTRSLVLVVLVDIYVLQNANGVISEGGDRTIERDQVRGNRLVIDAHETNREAGRHFSRKPWLE
jgi:hypothetical protein